MDSPSSAAPQVEFLDLKDCSDEERLFLAHLLGLKPSAPTIASSHAGQAAAAFPKSQQHPHRPPFPPQLPLNQAPSQLLNGHAPWNAAPMFPAMNTPRIAPFPPYPMPPAFVSRMPNINPYMHPMSPPQPQQHVLVPQPQVQQQLMAPPQIGPQQVSQPHLPQQLFHQQQASQQIVSAQLQQQVPQPQGMPQMPQQVQPPLPLQPSEVQPQVRPQLQQLPVQPQLQHPQVQPRLKQFEHPQQVQQQKQIEQQTLPPKEERGQEASAIAVNGHHGHVSNKEMRDNAEKEDQQDESKATANVVQVEPEAKDLSSFEKEEPRPFGNEKEKPSEKKIVEDLNKVNINSAEPLEEPQLPPKPRSWASLFSSAGSTTKSPPLQDSYMITQKQLGSSSSIKEELSTKHGVNVEKLDSWTSSVASTELAAFLNGYSLIHKPLSLRPRGLSNRSNWCFVNSVLQALMACPSFYNLIRAMPMPLHKQNLGKLTAMKAFASHFDTMANFPKLNRYRGKKAEDLPVGHTIEATEVLDMLLNLKPSESFKVVEGRQEDAEEFLSFLLNAMHDEMVSALKLDSDNQNDIEDEGIEINALNGDEWKEVGPKNRSCVTRRQARISTPLASIFQGQIRSSVQQSSGEPTANLQPFFTLQLDLQSESIQTVSDALTVNLSTEKLDGYICPSTKQVVAASQNLALEELPPVLILLLKRFVYDSSSGNGVQKLMKPIAFSVDLEVPRDVLSATGRNRFMTARQRQYKLFAVVSHNGTEANKGHYVTDAYHAAMATWLRFDDSVVKTTSESNVLSPPNNSCPYLLFYRRGDTTVPHDKLAKT